MSKPLDIYHVATQQLGSDMANDIATANKLLRGLI